MKLTTKLWTGVGQALIVSAAGLATTAPAAAGASNPMPAETAMPAGPGPAAQPWRIAAAASGHDHAAAAAAQGGEGGESGAAASGEDAGDPELLLYVAIAEIRGHLLVGDELIKTGDWKGAMPHFLHPAEELYDKIKPSLKSFGIGPFDTALKSLAQSVKDKKADAYASALALLDQHLAEVDAAMRAKEPEWAHFALETALQTLKDATGEYEEAIVKGKIANIVEYQDSRGFVFYADKLIDSVADDLKKKDAEAFAAMKADITALKAAWPAPVPPKTPVLDYGQMLSGVSKIELHAGKLM